MSDNFKTDSRYAHLPFEKIQEHYLVERQLREKIFQAKPHERASVIIWAYEELFRRIPWHPALTEDSGASATEVIEQKVKIFLPLLPPAPAIILEIGCGMGELSYGLTQKGYHCTGMDISDVRMERLRKSLNPHLTFARGDATFLPFISNYFDAVISTQLFEHLHPKDALIHLDEVNRVLKTNGRYIMETPNRLVGPGDVSRFFVDGEADGFHLKEYNITEMIYLLTKHGFSSIEAILWKSKRINCQRAILMEKIWGLFPKIFRKRHTMGLHNPIFVAYKRQHG
jgi:SAM-dependent methyltransferase